ncbi:hypothetical protein L0222_31440 [bacterium]|nr:hypothetical protein [bacterium]MCI0606060.1 hypothetical protein [bacterium]
MNRRSFGLLVRLIAVLAAIYALFTLRSQFPEEKPLSGPIPVTVVSDKQTPCGCIIVRPVVITDHASPKAPVEQNPTLKEAILDMGKPVTVRDLAQCERLAKLHDSVFSIEKGSIRIHFEK